MGAAAARNIIATGAGSGMRLRSGVQGLSRRQGDLARRQPVMGIAAQRSKTPVSEADYLSNPSTRQASLRSMTSADASSLRSYPYNRILQRGETPSFQLSEPSRTSSSIENLSTSSENYLDSIRRANAQRLYEQDLQTRAFMLTPAARLYAMRRNPPTPSETAAIRHRRFMRAEFPPTPHASSAASSGYWNRNIASGDSWPSILESMSSYMPSAITPIRRNPAGSDRAMTPNERYWQRGFESSSTGPGSSIYPRSTTPEYPRSLSTYPISSYQFSSSSSDRFRPVGQGIDNPSYVYDDLPQARLGGIYKNLYDLPQARRVRFADFPESFGRRIRPRGGWKEFGDRVIPVATAGAVGLGVGAALGAGVASMQPRKPVPPVDAVLAQQAYKK